MGLLFIFLLACGDHGYYLDDCNYFHHYWNYFRSRRGWRSLLSICGINNNRRNNYNNYNKHNNYNNHNNNNNNHNNNYNNYNNYNNNNGRNNNDNICYRRWWYFRKWQYRITPTYQALSSSFKVKLCPQKRKKHEIDTKFQKCWAIFRQLCSRRGSPSYKKQM